MKNDISRIKNEVAEIVNEKKLKHLKEQQKEKDKDFAKLCKALVYTTIYTNFKNNDFTLYDIYLQRDTIVKSILEDIKSKTIEVEDYSEFKTIQKVVRKYDYPDYYIIDVLTTCFYSEYSKLEREYKKELAIKKKTLQQELLKTFKQILKEKPRDVTYSSLILALRLGKNKESIIADLSKCEDDTIILSDIYSTILNKIKVECVPLDINTKDTTKLALSWRIIAYKKAIKTLWKL